jgi:uncharacterized membrane protein
MRNKNMPEQIITVTLYYRPDDPETQRVEDELASIQPLIPHRLVKINIEDDEIIKNRYISFCPAVEVGPYLVKSPVTKTDLVATLGATNDRLTQLNSLDDKKHHRRKEKGSKISKMDSFSYWFSKWYMIFFNLLVLLYVGIPFLAPVFSEVGWSGGAKVIYAIYKPFCHQLAYRSWFLFGEQSYYPRAVAEIYGVATYEQVTGNDSKDLVAGRNVNGNEKMGYKVALCERDVALYGSILLFGIIFMVSGRKIKGIPWYIWVFLGILPIGLDGGSQLPGLTNYDLPVWLIRESTPFLRTLTGGLFGSLTAWYLYPMIEESMRDTRIILSKKIASVKQRYQAKAT